MSRPSHIESELSRRRFIAIGGAAAAAGTVGPWIDPLSALGKPKWPKGQLHGRDATRVDRDQFMPLGQFRRWHERLDRVGPRGQRGLRATGSAEHEDYIDELRDQLERAGVKQVRFDPVPMKRWTASEWSLDLLDGAAAGPVRTASQGDLRARLRCSGRRRVQGAATRRGVPFRGAEAALARRRRHHRVRMAGRGAVPVRPGRNPDRELHHGTDLPTQLGHQHQRQGGLAACPRRGDRVHRDGPPTRSDPGNELGTFTL